MAAILCATWRATENTDFLNRTVDALPRLTDFRQTDTIRVGFAKQSNHDDFAGWARMTR